MTSGHQRGLGAETLAVWWLRLRGFSIVARRFQPGRGTGGGEIDIVARRGGLLAFVEVKARADRDCAAWSISESQKARIVRGAEIFLAQNPDLAGCRMRFDAILVAPGQWPRHIRDAWRIQA